MAKCQECVHYGVCKVLIGEQKIRIADIACSFAETCVAYKHKENFAEVVRCRDCKRCELHRFFNEKEESLACVDIEDGEVVFAQRVDGNHFCSYGEKRKEA